MSNLINKILVNKSTRMILLIFLFLIGVVSYFFIHSYYSQISLLERSEHSKVNAIVQTVSHALDGDLHKKLTNTYLKKNDIKETNQDSIYHEIHQLLNKVKKENKLNSDIYTLIYNPIKKVFFFGVTSAEKPYFRHEYKTFPEILKTKYKEGAIIPKYSDENGIWLSAFHPIYNKENNVVAIIQADVKFNEFIMNARKEVYRNLVYSFIIILIIGFFLYRSVKKILRQEDETKALLINQKKEIEQKNRDITDSINYAKKIQDAILPSKSEIKKGIENYFVMFKPRDIVSGDFYWYHELANGEQIIAVADCTGHGIPGALVSVIGSSLLNEIVKQRQITSPAEILVALDQGVNEGLGNTNKSNTQRDGMDIAICKINATKTSLTFSGAFRPLLKVNQTSIEEYKGHRFPIGGGDLYNDKAFQNIEIPIEKNDAFYMFSDGFPDQFGGPKGKKLMTKKFKDIIIHHQDLSFKEQCNILENELHQWKGENNQNDDILVIGFSFP